MVKNSNIIIMLITSIIAILITLQLYDFLYDKCFWSNLNDLYTGLTIYSDHNKYLDLSVIFIYTALFFLLLPPISILCKKFKINELTQCAINKIKNVKPVKFSFEKTLCKYQYIGLTGYLFLYPFDREIYPALIFIITALIIAGIIDIRKRNIAAGGGISSFSPWVLASILFIIFHNPYNQPGLLFDAHHLGEKYAAYYMHETFNMNYYKDIMLVHGLKDILPSICGKYLFGSISVYSSMLGDIFLKNISVISACIICSYIFSECIIFAIPSVIIPGDYFTKIYYCFYLIFLKNINQKSTPKLILWIIAFIIISFLFMINWTTIGSFWIISALPLACFMLYKLLKQPNKLVNIFILTGTLLILLIPNKDFIIEYLKQAQYYVAGNLCAFGNNFGSYDYSLKQTLYYLPRFIIYIFLPIFIIELVYNLKNRKIIEAFFCTFTIIFSIISVNYAFGRIDYEKLTRIAYISMPFAGIMLPYYLYIKFPDYRQTIIKPVILLYLLISVLFTFNNFINKPLIMTYKKGDKLVFLEKNTINEINSNNTFLDLTNHGIYYMYLNKKIPIPYTSFYNSISTKQAENSLKKLIKLTPDIILIHEIINLDCITPSLRINPIYRWMLLCGHYKLINEKRTKSIYLKHVENKINYTKQEFNLLDFSLSKKQLYFLPEVWGNSIKTLPMHEIHEDFEVYYGENKIIIEFKKHKKGRDIDLLFIEPVNTNDYKKLKNYFVEINDSKSILQIKSHRNGKMLIPIDNFASWLLSENIKTITIYSDEELKTPYNIRFYKRNFSDDMKKYL